MTLNHLKGVFLFKDASFSALVKEKHAVMNALLIVFSVAVIVSSLGYVIQQLVYIPFIESFAPHLLEDLSVFSLHITVLRSIVWALAGTVVFAGVVLLSARLLGATSGTYKQLLIVFGHAYAIQIVSFLPIVSFAALAYSVAVAIKGVSVVTDLSVGRAAAAYLLPILVVIVLGVIIGFVAGMLAIFALV